MAARRGDASRDPKPRAAGYMPSPRAAAAAVLGMLALRGRRSARRPSQIAQSAGLSSILLEVAPPPPAAEPEPLKRRRRPAVRNRRPCR